jgi:Zn-dependent peptidase ImmA (M78 family)
MTEEQVRDEQDALYHFVGRHDLARGLKGVFLPALFLLRQGEKAWVCTDDRQALLPFDAVRRTLSELGECLADNVQTSDHPRARYALEGWRNREAVLASHFWHLRSGLGTETRVRLEGGEAPADFWEADPESGPADNELLAAARLSAGVVGIDDQRTILDRIKQAPHGDMRRIDELAMTIRRDLDATARPYEQGYALAANLALELNDASDAPVDPEALLRDWEIGIEELTLDNCPVDAVAVWGPRYGPVIMLNIGEGARPRHIHGRRTTLAHEICHLLMDRDGALPFSEALGGRTPLHVEQRARAFAAEFLLPRENAVACVRHCESIAQALSELSQGFNVSREVAALQVRNSRAWFDLSEEEKSFLLRTSEG